MQRPSVEMPILSHVVEDDTDSDDSSSVSDRGETCSISSLDHHIEEIQASGSNDIPRKGYHHPSFPREGYKASDAAVGCNFFPPKPVNAEILALMH